MAIRHYPFGEMAAQTLGHVGQVSEEELEAAGLQGRSTGAPSSASRVSSTTTTAICAASRESGACRSTPKASPSRQSCEETAPKAGHDLKLSIDLGLEQEGEKRVARRRVAGPGQRQPRLWGGVCGDQSAQRRNLWRSAPIRAIDPNRFAKPMTQAEYDQLNGSGESEGPDPPAPLLNRAVEGQYPTGSTFKPITAMAALEAGVINPERGAGWRINASKPGAEQFCNSGHTDYGALAAGRSAEGLLGHLFLHGRRVRQQPRRRYPEHGTRSLGSAKKRTSTCRKRSKGRCPIARWRAQQNKLQESCERSHPKTCRERLPYRLRNRPVDRRRQYAPRGRTGRTADLSATDGGRLLDACQRLHERRRRHGRASPSGRARSTTPMAVLCRSSPAPPIGHVHLNYSDLSDVMEGIHDADLRAGRHLGRCVVGLEPGRTPGVRQDGHRRTHRPGRTGVVHVLPARPQASDRDRGDRRTGRLRRRSGGADRAADRLQVVPQAG